MIWRRGENEAKALCGCDAVCFGPDHISLLVFWMAKNIGILSALFLYRAAHWKLSSNFHFGRLIESCQVQTHEEKGGLNVWKIVSASLHHEDFPIVP